MASWKCGVLVTWQAGLEAGRGRGRETMDCKGILGYSKWRLVTTFSFWRSPLPENFRYYNGNVYTWYCHRFKHERFFLCWQCKRFRVEQREGVFFSWLWFWIMQLYEIIPTGKFPKRPWNLWKASTVHEEGSIGNIGVSSLTETGKEEYMARKANFKLVSECNWKNTFFNFPNVHVWLYEDKHWQSTCHYIHWESSFP